MFDPLNRLLLEIEGIARQEDLPIIGPEKGSVLEDSVRKYQPRRILEIGTLIGYSSLLMSRRLAEGAKIISVEIDPGNAARALQNIERAGKSGTIEVRVGHALQIIPQLEESYDMLFLDATKSEYEAYLRAAEPKLSVKAVVVADNVKMFEQAMKGFLDYVRNSGRYRSRTFDFGFDAVEVSERI